MKYITFFFLLFFFIFSCDYPAITDTKKEKNNLANKIMPIRYMSYDSTFDTRNSAEGILTQNYDSTYLLDSSGDILVDSLSFFTLPGDLTCNGIDDNLNGYTDEDCIRFLEQSGDTGVFPGYIISKSPNFKLKGYYWVSSK